MHEWEGLGARLGNTVMLNKRNVNIDNHRVDLLRVKTALAIMICIRNGKSVFDTRYRCRYCNDVCGPD